LHLIRAPDGALGFRVLVGGGMGRTPIIGSVIREFLPWQQYLTYIESILRVYNRHGRRDNIHKARIKILVRTLGIEEFAREVEEDFAPFADGPSTVTDEELHRVASYFAPAPYEKLEDHPLDEYTAEERILVFVEKIRHGAFLGAGGPMPPFSMETLSDQDVGDILTFLCVTP
jgi:sulfite reductase beta subunit-like hemoprotein